MACLVSRAWIAKKNSCFVPWKSATFGLSACGSPMFSGTSNRWRSPPPNSKAPSRRESDSTVPAIEGFSRVSEADTVARPDASTFQILPWAHKDGAQHSARMFCDITMPDGSPSWADPRHVLRRQLSKASDLGFSCYVHPEIEFFLLENGPIDGTPPIPADSGGYFDQAVHDSAPNFRRHAIDALESMGISVEFSHHEAAPGSAGDRSALRRRPLDGRQRHDVPVRREGGRDR